MEIKPYVILFDADQSRIDNVKSLKHQYPKTRVFSAISWKDHQEEILNILNFFNITLQEKMNPFKTKNHRYGKIKTWGKIARWASLILAFKYCLEFKIEEFLLLEDDLRLPDNLNLKKHKLSVNNSFMKLSKFGEAYYLNHFGASKFFNCLGDFGICAHSDAFIDKHVATSQKIIFKPKDLIVKTNQGHIRDTDHCNLTRKPVDKKIKIKEHIFRGGGQKPNFANLFCKNL